MSQIIHYTGLDVHKETIAVSIAPSDSSEVRRYGLINGSLDAIDKLVKKLSQPEVRPRFVYEAGPCGFVLCRHLRAKGLHCDVVAPSLVPKRASDKMKTDRRDADQLARLFRAGELSWAGSRPKQEPARYFQPSPLILIRKRTSREEKLSSFAAGPVQFVAAAGERQFTRRLVGTNPSAAAVTNKNDMLGVPQGGTARIGAGAWPPSGRHNTKAAAPGGRTQQTFGSQTSGRKGKQGSFIKNQTSIAGDTVPPPLSRATPLRIRCAARVNTL